MISKKSVKLSKYEFKKLALEAFQRDGFKCQLKECMDPMSILHPHHIIPRGRLHLDILCNILTVCQRCHRLLHDGSLTTSVDDLIDEHDLRGYLKCN